VSKVIKLTDKAISMDNNKQEESLVSNEKIVLKESYALSLLSKYASDTDEESEEEKKVEKYREKSSSSSSDSDEDNFFKLRQNVTKALENHQSDSDDSDGEHVTRKNKKREPLKVKGELLLVKKIKFELINF
jgi:hypothetical protein